MVINMSIHISQEKAEHIVQKIFESMGYCPSDSKIASKVLVATDSRGVTSHGIARIPMYYAITTANKNGQIINQAATLKVIRDKGPIVALDADHGLGIIMAPQAMDYAIKRAKEVGICMASVVHSGHFGAAGVYSSRAAEEGFAAIVISNTGPSMVAPGSKGRVLSNCPWSIALPGGKFHTAPVLFDMATSESSWGKCEIYLRAGKEVPDTWGVDRDGQKCTDPAEILQHGALLPFGGNKGYCLTFLLEMLSVAIPGANYSYATGTDSFMKEKQIPENLGHFILVFDPTAFTSKAVYQDKVDEFVSYILGLPAADPKRRAFVPGTLESSAIETSNKNGIEINDAVLREVQQVAIQTGLLKEGNSLFDI